MNLADEILKNSDKMLANYKVYMDLGQDTYDQVKLSWQPPWEQMMKTYRFLSILSSLQNPQTNWTTEYEVIYENQTMRLLHFLEKNVNLSKPPLLLLPPQAGHHSNVADYSATQSLVRVFQSYGYDTYVCDWQSAVSEYKDLGMNDHIRLTDEAVNVIIENCESDKIHIMGHSQGGWQAAVYTSLFQEKIATLAVAAAPIDVDAAPSPIVEMAQKAPMEYFEMLVALGNGLMNGRYMLTGFKSMQMDEHYVNKYYRLWEMIQSENEDGIQRFIHFENWYEYTQFLPGRFYLDIIKNIFKENNLIKPGALVLDGRGVDLRNINCPVIILAGEKDRITPPAQAFALKNYISTPKEKVMKILTKGGHIGTLMGTEALREDWTAVAEALESIV